MLGNFAHHKETQQLESSHQDKQQSTVQCAASKVNNETTANSICIDAKICSWCLDS